MSYTRYMYAENVSMRLSRVLDEIGVNESLVMKRRRTEMTEETLETVTSQLQGFSTTMFNFGSRTEGTTTIGLHSDTDHLSCNNFFNIIQDENEWQPDFCNLMMVRDETTPPGYCLLQMLYGNVPIPVHHATHAHLVNDRRGRVLMRNSWFVDNLPAGCTRHGPSQMQIGEQGFADNDLVYAYRCKSWPHEARAWLQRGTIGNWPTEEMKRLALNDGCFLVPVGCHGTDNEELQWRISTSLTERRLMFSLNITQIRCYVLMKMILKSFLDLGQGRLLTSFMCKTILIRCIENTHAHVWQENNLLACLNSCLTILYHCVTLEHCPHFIIEENNLLARRLSRESKHMLQETIFHLISSEGRDLLRIETDDLGMRIQGQFQYIENNVMFHVTVPSALDVYQDVSGMLLHNISNCLSGCTNVLLSHLNHSDTEHVIQTFLQLINKVEEIYIQGNEFEKVASKLLKPFLCTSLGSVLASYNISRNQSIPRDSLVWFSLGLNEGISARLKLASMFYSINDMARSLYILEMIERYYDIDSMQSICGCHDYRSAMKDDFKRQSPFTDKSMSYYTGLCLKYLPCEFNCIPEELQHEMFRSDYDARPVRGYHDYWMDWAVVDAIPYLYFLQYKVYSNLGDEEGKQRAFTNLRRTIDTDPSLGHPETALNLLGQCMEQEDRLDEALHCFRASLNIREQNNAANEHNIQILQKINDGQ